MGKYKIQHPPIPVTNFPPIKYITAKKRKNKITILNKLQLLHPIHDVKEQKVLTTPKQNISILDNHS